MDQCNNLPSQLINRWENLFTEKEYKKLLFVLTNKLIASFRINTIRTTSEIIERELTKQGFEFEKVSWYKDAYIMKNKSIRDLTDTETYKNGFIYIQNLSSMIPALVLDPKDDEKVLDIAAAPGSKATQIAALMHNTGELTANDISFKRLFKLKENLKQMGVTNAKVLNLAGESFWKKLPEYFDKTLVDVPCSMEGRIKCDDPKTYKDWSTKKIKQLSQMQKYLLRSAVSATKVGGTIVYSTCTMAPEENEEVIEWVVQKSPSALVVEKIEIANLQMQKGLTSWKNKHYKYTSNCQRIIPSQTMEGFFITKLHKTASTL